MPDVAAIKQEDVIAAINNLSADQRSDLIGSLIGRPTKVNGLYWLVLGTACIIMIFCILRLTGAFILLYPDQSVEFWKMFPDEDKITGLFTTVLSFVVGMFVPSPVAEPPTNTGAKTR